MYPYVAVPSFDPAGTLRRAQKGSCPIRGMARTALAQISSIAEHTLLSAALE